MRIFALLFLLVNVSYSAKFVAVLETMTDREAGVSSSELRYLTDELRKQALNALPTSAGFSLMTRENILAMLPPGKTLEECAGECMVETGRNLNADFVAQARVVKVGSRLALTVELYETRGAKLVASFTERSAGIDDLIDKVSQQSPVLFGKVSGKSDPKQRTEGNLQAREGTREESGIGELDLGEAPVLVRLESTPAGAVAMIDGKLACSATPCGKTLPAGAHSIQFGLERYLDTTLSITVRSGMPKVAVKLTPGWGTLDISTSPTGQPVQVNGKDQGASPLHLELSPGIYELVLGSDCMRRKTVTVNLARGQSRQVSEALVAREAGLSLQATDAKTGDDLAARVFVDGNQVGETPYVGKASTCAQTIEVEADGYPRTEVKVQLTEGKKTQATVTLEQRSKDMFTDPRDGQKYRVTKIGSQVWMAQNLNYKTGNSSCYDDNANNCSKFGRLYDWETAKQACPTGWHLPTSKEWDALTEVVGGANFAGAKLKAVSGWNNNGKGTDVFGFSALPAGLRGGSSDKYTFFWSATETNESQANARTLYASYAYFLAVDYDKITGFSARCLQN